MKNSQAQRGLPEKEIIDETSLASGSAARKSFTYVFRMSTGALLTTAPFPALGASTPIPPAGVDMALDDVIKQSSRGSGGVVRGGRPPRRSSARLSAPYQRSKEPLGEAVGTMSGASVSELAASDNPKLKASLSTNLSQTCAARKSSHAPAACFQVSGESKPNSVAGAICNIVREGHKLPSLLATGPTALNQARTAPRLCSALPPRRRRLGRLPPPLACARRLDMLMKPC